MSKNSRLFTLLAAVAVLASNTWASMKGESAFRSSLSKVVKLRTVSRSDGSICTG